MINFSEYRKLYPLSPFAFGNYPPEENIETIIKHPELFTQQGDIFDYDL